MQNDASRRLDTEEFRAWIDAPVAVQVAACGKDLRPQSVRAFGVSFDAAGALQVALLDAQCPPLLRALRVGRPVAVNLTHPLTFLGRQLKGPVVELAEPSLEAGLAAQRYFDRFVQVLAKIGMTPEQCRGMFYTGPARFLRMQPAELFDQTPGAGAGARL
jgi:hypothetical protein